MYTVYILYSPKLERYYIGFTEGLIITRLKKHLANHRGFTGIAKDWEVVYTEEYKNKKDAMLREKEIKNWKSRVIIEKLIRSTE